MRSAENNGIAAVMASGNARGAARKLKVAGKRATAAKRGGAAKPFFLDQATLARARVLVVGDVMLDRYWFGEVSRVSPEAPVPIVKIDRTEDRPGGAANVARNAAALGASVTLLSVVGSDQPGQRLAQLLKADGVRARLHRDRTIDTTVKLRVLGRRQQLLRIDFETTPSHEVLLDKFADYKVLLAQCDIVILSDYAKGGLTHISKMIDLAIARGKRVLVDPKGEDFSRYRGATMVTPNRGEFRQVVGGWRDERELALKAQAQTRGRIPAADAQRGGYDLVPAGLGAARSGQGARGVRCQRRGRHGHRGAGGHARSGRVAARGHAHRQSRRRRGGGQAGHRRGPSAGNRREPQRWLSSNPISFSGYRRDLYRYRCRRIHRLEPCARAEPARRARYHRRGQPRVCRQIP
jgi:sugar/nucleoside kinase (ribokinase family)